MDNNDIANSLSVNEHKTNTEKQTQDKELINRFGRKISSYDKSNPSNRRSIAYDIRYALTELIEKGIEQMKYSDFILVALAGIIAELNISEYLIQTTISSTCDNEHHTRMIQMKNIAIDRAVIWLIPNPWYSFFMSKKQKENLLAHRNQINKLLRHLLARYFFPKSKNPQ